MSEAIGVTVAPAQLQLAPGGAAEVVVTVVNQGPIVDQLELLIDGFDATWYAVRPSQVSLFPGSDARMVVELHLPEGTAAGPFRAEITVRSRARHSVLTLASLELEVLPVGGFTLDLSPRLVTTRRAGHFRLVVRNVANTEQLLDLRVDDPEAALEARFALDRVAVGPASTETVALTVSPRLRPLVAPPRRYPFTVQATPPTPSDDEGVATEAVGAVDGALVYRAPLAVLAAIPPRIRPLLLAIAGLLLVAALAIWHFAAPGPRGPSVAHVPVATPARPAIPTVPPLVLTTPPVARTAGGAATTPTPGVTPSPAAATTAAPLAAEPLPVITQFALDHPPGTGQGVFALHWAVQGARVVTIDGTPRPAVGTVTVHTLQDRQFELAARNDSGTVARTIGVVILRPPRIVAFQATPAVVVRGQAATLVWSVHRAERAGIDGKGVDPAGGTMSVRPTADTTYQLVVENELGRDSRAVHVHVVTPTPTPRP